jgi:hypothetical protein
MNSPATALPPGRSRLALIVAGVLALLGSLVVTAPAQAGYYEGSYYGSNPCSYRCGYPRYGYAPRYYNGCSACGCYRRCGSGYRSGLVYERRFVERVDHARKPAHLALDPFEALEHRRLGKRSHPGYIPLPGIRFKRIYRRGPFDP